MKGCSQWHGHDEMWEHNPFFATDYTRTCIASVGYIGGYMQVDWDDQIGIRKDQSNSRLDFDGGRNQGNF